MSSYNELLNFVGGKIKGLQDCLDTLADRDSAKNQTNKNLAEAKADCTSKASTLKSNVATYVTNDKSGNGLTFNAFCTEYEKKCSTSYVVYGQRVTRTVSPPKIELFGGVSSRNFRSSVTVASFAGTGVEVVCVGISFAIRGFCIGPTLASFSGSALNISALLLSNRLNELKTKVAAVENAALSMDNVLKAVGDDLFVARANIRTVSTRASGLSMYFV